MAKLIVHAGAPHIALAIHLLFATAGRVGSVLDLTWDRVNMERSIINLRLDDARTRKGRAIVPINRGLKDVTLHTIRHSAAVVMVSSGVPIEKVAQYLGHSNISVTYSTYGRFAPGRLSDAAEVLEFTNLRVIK